MHKRFAGKQAHNFGRKFESRVERILIALKKGSYIDGWKRYVPNGKEDSEGKDFFIRRGDVSVDFGVTTSRDRLSGSLIAHPEIKTLCFDAQWNDFTIANKILALVSTEALLPPTFHI